MPITHQAAIDEYGDLARVVALHAPTAARYAALSKEIQSWYANAPATSACAEHGALYSVQLSPRRIERRIALSKLYKFVGKLRFIGLCSVTLKALDGAVAEGDQARLALVTSEPTGHRTLTVALMAKAA